jgi:hypothetical protein
MAEVTTTFQSITVAPVSRVLATEVEADLTSGTYVREVRVFTTDDDGTEIPLFSLRLEGASAAAIELVTPALHF